ncbi:MAG: CotH kinase family protein [Fibrobacter sp.]|nr:CotH kinase family protein [Fibrobacter sp.]
MFFKKIANVAALGCLGLCLFGLAGCLIDEEASMNSGSTGSTDAPVGSDGKPLPTYTDTVTTIDTITGQVITKIDTFYLPEDTTLRWVGNSALKITEIAPVNLDWLDEDGGDPGWVEIYNAGSDTANLKNYTLVENRENARKWFFGNVKIAPKGFITVFCDKKNVQEVPPGDDHGNIHYRPHTNWKLEKDGGILYLIDPYYGIRDTVVYPELTSGLSWGIMNGGVWKYFDKPTPEKPNTSSTAYDGVAPEFSFAGAEGGFYNDEVTLKAPTAPEGMKIRCTRNGSAPTKDSPEFNQTITISENTVLRCAAFKDGLLTNKIVTNTYFIGEMVKMPVVAVSVDSVFFKKHYVPRSACGGDNPKTCPAGLMEDIEFPVHVEYFAAGSDSKSKTWEIDAGISLMGGWSRVADKKSVAIVMREEYEAGWLKPPADAPLFETRKEKNNKFKGFNLRNNGNRFVSDYIEDAVGGAALEGSGVDYQRSRQVVVFYNGKYWGIHDMRERYNKNYVETNYDIDAGSVEMIKILGKYDSSLTGNTVSAVSNFTALLNFVGEADFSGENNEAYAFVKTLMDVGNFADYMAAEIYYKNGDWPNNNVRAWRAPEHPWKFMIYDLDHGFGWKWGVNDGEFQASSTNMFDWIKKGGGNKPCKEQGCFANLYIKLIKNPDFVRLFLNRAAMLFQNNVNGSNIGKIVNTMVASMNSNEIERDLEKFKQEEKYYPGGFSKDGKVLVEWAESRDEKIYDEFEKEFGLSGTVSVTISANGKGSVEIEGRKISGSTYKGKFFAGNGIMLEAKAGDGAMFTNWSDGSTDNPRLVEVSDGASFTANFK